MVNKISVGSLTFSLPDTKTETRSLRELLDKKSFSFFVRAYYSMHKRGM